MVKIYEVIPTELAEGRIGELRLGFIYLAGELGFEVKRSTIRLADDSRTAMSFDVCLCLEMTG